MVKPITFRPTPKIQRYIDSELEKHPTKGRTEVINELCEQAILTVNAFDSYSGQPREGLPSPTMKREVIVIEGPIERAFRELGQKIIRETSEW